MSPNPDMPSASSVPRRPLSLRELFILTTLVGATIGLVRYYEWTAHERWLLGLTLGGGLSGILSARMLGRRGWLAGVLAGTLGGLLAIGIIGQDWLTKLDQYVTDGWDADSLAKFERDYFFAAATTAALAVLLALLLVAGFQLLVWALTSGEQGMWVAARRHPYRTATVAVVVGSLILGLANFDFLLAPRAWSPRHFIPIDHADMPLNSGEMDYYTTGALSRNGDYLAVHSHYGGRWGPPIADEGPSKLFRLDPRPELVQFSATPLERFEFLAFDCDKDQIAFLENDPIRSLYQVHVVDLSTLVDTPLSEDPRERDLHSIHWLPRGTLVYYYGDDHNGKTGYTRLRPGDGQWHRQESKKKTVFDPRSGKAIEYDDQRVRIVDSESMREVEAFSKEWLDEMGTFFGDDPTGALDLSPDGRFVIYGAKIYDRRFRTFRDFGVEDGFPQPCFYVFTTRNYAVYHEVLQIRTWRPIYFMTHVPFGERLMKWLWRDPVRLIDPESGLEVARTQPLWPWPNQVTLSHDGSRMAVFNDKGVYVYDVPEKFR